MGQVFIDPLSDGGFKRFFGIEGKSETFLLDFLNSLFKEDPEIGEIVSVRYLNNEQNSGNIHQKEIRYDLHCETDTGHRFIVEMQRDVRPHFEKRAIYYVSKAVADQLNTERDGTRGYRTLMPVIGLYVLETSLPGKEEKILLDYRYREKDNPADAMGLTRMVFVQLGNFNRKEEECVTPEEQWFYVLKNLNKMEYMPFREVRDRVFEKLGEYAKVSNLTGAEKQEYDRMRKFQLDYYSDIYDARTEGIAKGRAEGEAKGMAKGIQLVALKMKQSGDSVDRISELTGLTPDEIASL